MSQDRAAWLAERRSYLGGTDMAQILGASEWGGQMDVWLKKVQGVRTPAKWIMDLGNFLEGAVAQIWVDRRRLSLQKPEPFRHPEFDFLGGNPDFLCVEDPDLGNEIKTASSWSLAKAGAWAEDGGPLLKLDYWVQCQWYMGLTGRRRWELGAAFYDMDVAERLWRKHEHIAPELFLEMVLDDFRIYPIEFDAEFFAMAVDAGVRFWNDYIQPFVEHGIEIVPPASGVVSKEARAWMLRRASAAAPKLLRADEAAEALFATHAAASLEEKDAKVRKDAAKVALEALLASEGAQSIVGSNRQIKLNAAKDVPVEDTEAVIADLAGLMQFSPEALAALRRSHTTFVTKDPETRVTEVKPKKSSKTTKASDEASTERVA